MLPIRSLFSLFLALGLLGLISSPKVLALSASDLLPAEEAFRLSHQVWCFDGILPMATISIGSI